MSVPDTRESTEFAHLHGLLEILHTIDVGLVVLDREYRIRLWNGFMENHSGLRPEHARGRSLFQLFSDVPEEWFRSKAESVFLLGSPAFTIWEQHPHLFPFKNYRPVTGTTGRMFQNATLIPLHDTDGEIRNICLVVYDVTDSAVSRQALESANRRLERQSRTDGLTGLLNRRAWEDLVVHEHRRFQRTGEAASLVMLDIDHFKAVNDRHGHQAGDAVIAALADAIRGTSRVTDIPGRYGGEEFGIVLVGTPAKTATAFAERLRRTAEESDVEHGGRSIRFTISLGISGLDSSVTSHSEWIERADKSLYAAKEGGRNRYVVFA